MIVGDDVYGGTRRLFDQVRKQSAGIETTYVDLTNADAFAENQFVGRSLRIGSKVVVSVLERDPRCMMITLDPDTAEKTPAILKQVAQAHEGMAGVYGAVLMEGMIRKGDSVELID